MGIAEKYDFPVAWRTFAKDVAPLTRETTDNPATYRMSVKAIDTNEKGAGQTSIDYFVVDFWGDPYSIIATGSGYIDVRDDFRTGKCPTSGKMAIIFESAFQGSSIYLPTASFQFLHPLALINIQKYNLPILWGNDPNPRKFPFTNTELPTISGYQSDRTDPEDALKTINYAELYGNDPNVRCIIVLDANNSYQLQQMPLFTFVDGLLDAIRFEPGQLFSGYLIISKG